MVFQKEIEISKRKVELGFQALSDYLDTNVCCVFLFTLFQNNPDLEYTLNFWYKDLVSNYLEPINSTNYAEVLPKLATELHAKPEHLILINFFPDPKLDHDITPSHIEFFIVGDQLKVIFNKFKNIFLPKDNHYEMKIEGGFDNFTVTKNQINGLDGFFRTLDAAFENETSIEFFILNTEDIFSYTTVSLM